jgi:hypothetical protein
VFKKLPWAWRKIVFYSESGQDWHQFAGLIEELNGPLRPQDHLRHVRPADPGLRREHANYRAICIPEGLFLTIFFQVNRSDVFVLTMMDLHNLQLKRSLHPVHYVYLFHSMGSTHMVDNEELLRPLRNAVLHRAAPAARDPPPRGTEGAAGQAVVRLRPPAPGRSDRAGRGLAARQDRGRGTGTRSTGTPCWLRRPGATRRSSTPAAAN